MSSYISLYVRAKAKPGPYLYVMSWSRNNNIFQFLKDSIAYGTTVPLTESVLAAAQLNLADMRKQTKNALKDYAAEVSVLSKLKVENLETIEQICERVFEIRNAAAELKSDLKTLKDNQNVLSFLAQLVEESSCADDGVNYFLSYEDNPNISEKEKETD